MANPIHTTFTDNVTVILSTWLNGISDWVWAAYQGTLNLTGGQIAFPATQSPSADPNTLDDYEEGTTTPTVTAQTGTFTSAAAAGTYTKIGRQVTENMVVTVTTVGTAADSTICTLKFTPVNNNFVGSAFLTSGVGGLYYCFVNGGTLFIRRGSDSAFGLVNGSVVNVQITYFV